MRAMTWVKARGRNILPSIPCRAMIGMKVRAMMSSPKMEGLRTSSTAFRTVASFLPAAPASPRWRWTFSTWMMVASMIMPMEMASPPRDMRLAEMPERRIRMKVKRVERGRARMTMNAPRKLRRNRYRMKITRSEPIKRASVTVETARSMISLRL